MSKLISWLVVLIGVLLLLPMLGLDQLMSVTDWVVPLAVLLIGILRLMKK
jgi:hypothetical protein